jgi:hypothetical protein
MLDTAYDCIQRRGLEARSRGETHTTEIAQVALTALLEATLEAMNTLVDSAVAACEHVTDPNTPTVADTRLHRGDRLRILEQRFSFDHQKLPAWDAVALTSRQAGAVKHRLGLTWRPGTSTPLSIEDGVGLTEDELLGRIDDVRTWVEALGRATGLIPPVN